MKGWQKKFAVFVLLLLPLQALATSLSAFTCLSGAAHHSTTDPHDHGHGAHANDDGAPHQHDSDPSADHSGHLNCHHVFSGMPAAMVVNVPAELPEFESAISLLFTLFVPERPQRPPRV